MSIVKPKKPAPDEQKEPALSSPTFETSATSINGKLTVIVSVYNGMPFLTAAIDSILSQTYRDFRLLIVDDGSTDDSVTYLKSLTDPRVEVRQQQNVGLCESLNRAVESVNSEFVARLDQDDISQPDRLQQQMQFLADHSDYDCVLSNISRISASGKEFGHYEINASEPISDYNPEQYGCIVHSTICFRRNKFLELGGYRSPLYPADDYDLLLRFWETSKVAVINKPLVLYRIHSKAGTFSTFYQMQIKSCYVTAMSALRQNGKPEISLEEFVQTIDRTSPWGKLMRLSSESGKLLFRKAGLLVGEGQVALGVLNLLGALVCNPQFTTKRLLTMRKGS